VARRSARLAASLLVSVLRLQNWMEVPRRLVVAVDGGVFLKYNNWRTFLRQYLCEAFGACCIRAVVVCCMPCQCSLPTSCV
jgi:hexokinase